MVAFNRIGTALLLVGGLGLIGLMAHVVWDDPLSDRFGRAAGVEIAIVVPDRDDWQDVRQGVLIGARRGLFRLLSDQPDAVTVATERDNRRLRFTWRPAHGEVETAMVVRDLAARSPSPLAIVGSSNTAMTVALAHGLAESKAGRDRPMLLIPWATTSETPARTADGDRVPLLSLYPGRSFRFCPDNARLASLVTRAVRANDRDHPPGLVLLLRDPADPYSVDLARGFEAAIRRVASEAVVVEKGESVSSPALNEQPGPIEDACAERIWSRVRLVPPEQSAWLVLPLQGEPIRRIVRALEARAPSDREVMAPLHVLCGDGIGRTSLEELIGLRALSVWCATTGAPPVAMEEPSRDAIVPAEVASALAWAVDRAKEMSPEAVSRSLRTIDLDPRDPEALGRSLAFDARGERRHDDLGYVLSLAGGARAVLAHLPGARGDWPPPEALPPSPRVAQP